MTYNQELYDLQFLLFYNMMDLCDYSYAKISTSTFKLLNKYSTIFMKMAKTWPLYVHTWCQQCPSIGSSFSLIMLNLASYHIQNSYIYIQLFSTFFLTQLVIQMVSSISKIWNCALGQRPGAQSKMQTPVSHKLRHFTTPPL